MGVALIVLGIFIWWALTLDFTALETNANNPNPDVRAAAEANLRIIILSQVAILAVLTLVVVMTIKLHYFMKQRKEMT